MNQFVIPLTATDATDAGRFGPKAANLAALGAAGLPIPDGFCLDAEAYRAQIRALGLEADARGVFAAAGQAAGTPARARHETRVARPADHPGDSRAPARGADAR